MFARHVELIPHSINYNSPMKDKLIYAISTLLLLVTLISCNSDKNQGQRSASDLYEDTSFWRGNSVLLQTSQAMPTISDLLPMIPSITHWWATSTSKKTHDQIGTSIQVGKSFLYSMVKVSMEQLRTLALHKCIFCLDWKWNFHVVRTCNRWAV